MINKPEKVLKIGLGALAALMLAMVLFVGCAEESPVGPSFTPGPETPGDPGDPTPTPKGNPEGAAKLATALGGNASVEGSKVTLIDNITVSDPVTIPEGVTISVPATKTLTVADGATFTVADKGTVDVAGNLIVGAEAEGLPQKTPSMLSKAEPGTATFEVKGTINVKGALLIKDGATFKVEGIVNVEGNLELGKTKGISTGSYLTGTINILSGGTLTDATLSPAAAFWNGFGYNTVPSTGKFVIYSGAKATTHGNLLTSIIGIGSGATLTVRATANDAPTYEMAGGTVTLTGLYPILEGEDLLITSYGLLVIEKEATLRVQDDATV
jgi:hypothetical protein